MNDNGSNGMIDETEDERKENIFYDLEDTEEYLQFHKIKNPLSKRPDMHALLMLDKMFPEEGDMIDWAGHEVIGISISPEELLEVATKEELLDLYRCGLSHTENGLTFYV
jgi:hypothetical protein